MRNPIIGVTVGTPTSPAKIKRDIEPDIKEYIDEQLEGNDYELIETITLTEATSLIERTQEPDGTPYNFKDLFATVKCTGTEGVSGQWLLWGVTYGNTLIDIFRNVTLTQFCTSLFKTESDRNIRYLNMWGSSSNPRLADPMGISGATNLSYLITNEPITKLKIQHQTAIPVGVKISIYGVRV